MNIKLGCNECGECIAICPEMAITKAVLHSGVTVNPYKCTECGICVHSCPLYLIENEE